MIAKGETIVNREGTSIAMETARGLPFRLIAAPATAWKSGLAAG